jgi:hypothetical protein
MLLSTSAGEIDQICFRKGVEGLIGSALKHTPAKTPKVDCPLREAVLDGIKLTGIRALNLR